MENYKPKWLIKSNNCNWGNMGKRGNIGKKGNMGNRQYEESWMKMWKYGGIWRITR